MNVLIPMSGASLYQKSESFIYPKILTEVAGKTLLEHSQSVFATADESVHLIYAVPKSERKKLSLEAIINIVTENDATVFDVEGETSGALCTCLLAVDYIDLDKELIISSADHCLTEDLDEVLSFFRANDADAGVLSFESVHPKWSYASLNSEGYVKQTSEKKPISRTAMAGFFYFKKANDFVEAAKNVIRKQAMVNGVYFVSSSINEMILHGKKVLAKPLISDVYHSFYDAHSIKTFEESFSKSDKGYENLSRLYVHSFHSMDLSKVMEFFDEKAVLIDPGNTLNGKKEIYEFLKNLFTEANELVFVEKDIIAADGRSVIEFELTIDGKKMAGTDVIRWRGDKILSLSAYLY
jgi:choline kinase/ketosteroid isomerase-like protein